MNAEYFGNTLENAFKEIAINVLSNPYIQIILGVIIIAFLIKIMVMKNIGEYIIPISSIIYAIYSIINFPETIYHCVWIIILFGISIVFIKLRRIKENII